MSKHEQRQTADVLRTKRLEIVDDEGKPRVVVGMDNYPDRRCFLTLVDIDGEQTPQSGLPKATAIVGDATPQRATSASLPWPS